MEHDLVLEGKVVKPTGIEELQLGVSEGKIAEIARQGLRGGTRVKTERCLIFPGFVDIHVHLREPGWEYKEDFRTGSLAAIHGGVTAVVDMPNNPNPATTPEALGEKTRLAESKSLIDVKFFGGVAATTLDDIGRIKSKVVGYKVYLSATTGSRQFPEDLLHGTLERIRETALPVSLHCEDQAIIDRRSEELKGVSRQDVYCDIRPPVAELASVSKVVEAMSDIEGLRANVCHASTAGSLGLVEGARRKGLHLECEATLHHLFFTRKAMLQNRMLRTNPPLRPEEDRQALVKGLSRGEVSFLVTDHAPHTEEEKVSQELSGVPGLDDYAHMVSWLIKSEGIDPTTIAKVASSNPAEYAGLSGMGEVALGKSATFSIIDLNSPERVRSDAVWSKCGWSPYDGKEFPGRARWTVARGQLLLDDYEMVL